ncbi:MAG: hypothetical protein KGL95_00645 [Patescibacteria group bacterium]|nr:hypothetical protein [Patescibacteria group bacterium]
MSATAEDLAQKRRVEIQRERRAKAKAQKAEREKIAQTSHGTTVEPSEEFSLKMDVEEAIERPKQSFKERVLDKLNAGKEDDSKTKTTPKGAKEHVDKSYHLLSSVLPLTLSGIIALYSERLFSDAFKACAPSKEEVSTILLPIFSVISRHVEIEGKASQDAIDLGGALLAAIVVSTRMLMTAEEIRRTNGQPRNVTNIRPTGSDNSRGSASPVSESAVPGIAGISTGTNAAEAYWRATNDANDGNGNVDTGSTGPGLSEAERVAQLLRKDTLGRRQMGLAPRDLRE